MARLIDVAKVVRDGDRWAAGLEIEGLQCALSSSVSALCLPLSVDALGGKENPGGPFGYPTSPFAIIAQLTQPNMCRTADPSEVVRNAVDREADKALGRALWYGTGDSAMWFGAPGVAAVAAETSIAAMLQQFYNTTVGIDPVIHLGFEATADAPGSRNSDGRFKAFPDVPVVVNPSYPADGVAITGPIHAWIGPAEGTQTHDIRVNREFTEATALATVAFDPCAVIIRGTPPDQVFIGRRDDTVTVAVLGSQTASTVVWGDAAPNDEISPETTAGVDHVYSAPGEYTLEVTSESGTTTRTITIT